MDKIDRDIISLLQYDGRMPFSKIAARLDVSEGTVRRRVRQLTADGVLQVVAIVDPHLLGWSSAAMIGLTVQAGHIENVAQQLAQFPEISYLFMASGEFDLFAEVFCKNREHFVSFLNDKLQQVAGVQRTQTFTILKMYKLSYHWGEAEPPRSVHSSLSERTPDGLESRL